jgi:hypothetical protein
VRRGVGLALVLACFAAGCGGGGNGDFKAQAKAICKRYNAKITALGTPSSPADIPQYVEKAVPLIQQGVAELRALEPPQELAADYNRMLDETEKAIPAARALGQAAAKSDAAGVQKALKEGNAANQNSDRLATKIGLTECAAN